MTRIGPAGWAYKDWNGIVYPASRARGFHPAAFLARYFNTLEINVSFYRPVDADTAGKWLRHVETNPLFRFTSKLWRGFTHDRNATGADEAAIHEGLGVLLKAGRLGALLLQFPHSFRNSSENRDYVNQLRDKFGDYPLVLEVRHRTWSDPGVVDFLQARSIGLCNIDQPVFKQSLKPSAITTSPVGYVRLHGRRYDNWFTANEYAGERYDYTYSVEELAPWIDRVKTIEQSASDTYVITNNHYLGKAVVNAIEIASILKGEPVSGPSTLLDHYPELKAFTHDNPESGEVGQMSLL